LDLRLARKFHELNQAYELLVDPLRRLALDAKIRLKEAQRARFGKYDAKRKILVEELEERERAFKKAKAAGTSGSGSGGGGGDAERVRLETERIMAEGRRMREAMERAAMKSAEDAQRAVAEKENDIFPPALGAYPSPASRLFDFIFCL
jgi:DnaJ homolog subfamily C member 17